MIEAYMEIIVMLLGAFLLGMFVAWQYWKKKHKDLEGRYEQLESQSSERIDKLEKQVAELKQEVKLKAKEVEALEKEYDSLEKKAGKLDKEVKKNKKKNEELEEKAKSLNREVEVLDQELVAAHDELFALSKTPKKSTYYKYIDGKRYKAVTLREADAATEGKGDGRISKEDARKIFDTISDGKRYTPVEKATIRFVRENYKWTDAADQLFRHLVGSWAANDHNVDEINE